MISEITEFSPPRRWADRGVAGPIRENVSVTVEPLEAQTRSRVKIEIDFEGHGFGKLIVPLFVRRQAEREMPKNMQNLKKQLESSR